MTASSLILLTMVYLSASVYGCDNAGLDTCSSAMQQVVDKYSALEAKAKQYPQTCRGVVRYNTCLQHLLKNCTSDMFEMYKKGLTAYVSQPYNCKVAGIAVPVRGGQSGVTAANLVAVVVMVIASWNLK